MASGSEWSVGWADVASQLSCKGRRQVIAVEARSTLRDLCNHQFICPNQKWNLGCSRAYHCGFPSSIWTAATGRDRTRRQHCCRWSDFGAPNRCLSFAYKLAREAGPSGFELSTAACVAAILATVSRWRSVSLRLFGFTVLACWVRKRRAITSKVSTACWSPDFLLGGRVSPEAAWAWSSSTRLLLSGKRFLDCRAEV